jgi:hypothetical protein
MNRIQQQSATIIIAVSCREITLNKKFLFSDMFLLKTMSIKPLQSIQITRYTNQYTRKWHSMKITNIIKTVKHGTHSERRRMIKNICIRSRNMEISMRS